MTRETEREIEREREREVANARREQEYERRGRRGRSSDGRRDGGGSWRRRASRFLESTFDAALEGYGNWVADGRK